jgi:predicted ester cyclase
MDQATGPADRGLGVLPSLASRWHDLAPAVRHYLDAFLSLAVPGDRLDQVVIADPHVVPASFTDDLMLGGRRLRAAFPRLARSVVAIEGGDPLTIRVACEGTHDGPFFGFMLATHRRVRFDEVHELRVHHDRVAEDRLAIDLRAIIRQLGAATGSGVLSGA